MAMRFFNTDTRRGRLATLIRVPTLLYAAGLLGAQVEHRFGWIMFGDQQWSNEGLTVVDAFGSTSIVTSLLGLTFIFLLACLAVIAGGIVGYILYMTFGSAIEWVLAGQKAEPKSKPVKPSKIQDKVLEPNVDTAVIRRVT